MGGVDLKDQMLVVFLLQGKKMCKWYIKLFRGLFNFAVLNSYIIYKNYEQHKVGHLKFRIQLIEEIYNRCIEKGSRETFSRKECVLINWLSFYRLNFYKQNSKKDVLFIINSITGRKQFTGVLIVKVDYV